MIFKFTVEVEVERTEGKFAGKDELADQLRDAIEESNPQEVEGENGGRYDVTMWEVSDASA
jgi:hypothetical protein